MRVQTKLLLSIFPILLVVFVSLSVLSFYSTKDVMRTDAHHYIDAVLEARTDHTLERRFKLLQSTKMDKVSSFVELYQQEALADLTIGSDSKYGCFVVFDEKGNKLFSSSDCTAGPLLSLLRASALGAVADPLHRNRGMTDTGERRIFGARHFEPWDWVLVYSIETTRFETALDRILALTFGAASFCVAACVLVIVLVFRRVFGLPIVRLKTAAARIASREPNVAIEIASRDELGDLSASLNGMAKAISDYVADLQNLKGDLERSNEAMRLEIAERRKAQDELKEAHDKIAATFQAIPDLLFEVDGEGRIYDYHAPESQELFARPEQFLKKTVREVMPEEAAEQIMQALGIAAQRGWHSGTVYDLTLSSGKRWFELSIAAKGELRGSQTCFVATAHDITARMQADEENAKLEAKLNQAQKMESVGRLAGGVAHDFNNNLAVIIGHADLALDGMSQTQPLHENLTEILAAAERSADLTRQLLAFARKQTVAPRVLDLNETVAGMLKMLQRLIGEDIRLNWLPDGKLWPVEIDPSQLNQILANLCVNARDAIADVGKIIIETQNTTFDDASCAEHPAAAPGEYARLSVSDDGCGMDDETLAHVFEPFFTTKGVGEGTGLGLATVYGIVKQNSGFIGVESTPGAGTTFTIYLPRHVARPTELHQTTPAPTPLALGRETVLLVEDEPSILKMTASMLVKQGYTVLAASTPSEAIRLARSFAGTLHLLITDVVMPEMNGRDLAKHLSAVHPGLKRLFMSGYTADVIAHHGVLDGGVHFIQKPFSQKELGAKVRKALEGA